jgi:hypothetical protein
MKYLLAGAVLMVLASPAAAQTSTSPNPSMSNPQQNANSDRNLVAAQKIKQDLQNAGFTDVKVVAESFVVQAKSKDGDPVLMTIGPHGMSVFEAMNSSGSSSSNSTTGSSSSRMNQPGGNPASSTSPRPGQSR